MKCECCGVLYVVWVRHGKGLKDVSMNWALGESNDDDWDMMGRMGGRLMFFLCILGCHRIEGFVGVGDLR